MRVALLHLDLSGGPEARNLALLTKAATLAAEAGANWIVTPETALQGYFFAEKYPDYHILPQPQPILQPLLKLAADRQVTLFIGCAEQEEVSGDCYNSCVVIGPDGELAGRHYKLRSHGDAEAWARKGQALRPVATSLLRAGILICADSWYAEHACRLKDERAEVIVVPAAWPPDTCGPGDCWERCSAASGLPVWVCNQTGSRERMDFRRAQSAVVAGGQTRMTYSGGQAVLLFGWNRKQGTPLSEEFEVIPVEGFS